MGFLKDFKDFAIRGNVVDLAVGVIIGASFNKIVDVIVNGIILPPIGLVTGGLNFADKKVILRHAVHDAHGKVIEPENALRYGELIQAIIIFVITAFAIFMLIRGLKRLHIEKEKEEKKEPSTQEKLLMEIRDLLKEKSV